MFSFNDIFQQAQGGAALQNLAEQFGLSTTQVQKAIEAVTPALSAGLQERAQDPSGLADLFGAMFNDRHQQAFEDASAANTAEAAADGEDALARLFGGPQAQQALAAHAAQATGLSSTVMQSMLPVIVSMLMGGMFKGLAGSGLGGMLEQLGKAGAASPGNSSGGLGDLFGQVLGGSLGGMFGSGQSSNEAPQRPGPGGTAGGLGDLLGGMFGGAGRNAGRSADAGMNAGAGADQLFPPGFDQASLKTGLDALGQILGGDDKGGKQPGLGDLLSQMFGQKR